ncbi:class III signal peptide-containing protein [Pyrococcus furiosus DSM 3638]|uniref:Class III signal peptide-containing protein n=2 Tax=Pyrococcus furiosus TaxID=2261 RepID=A0A5C0XP43_PYRFU|nr:MULTISPECIES: class III signal peptide-containing protein [Pyrococcus]AFN03266.1 hypothetical protein PFC_01475 [Pyrococcus furiosus COM1]MDK2869347.1 hypothetical protein [Pyrococcus sp.]QEK78185.1 class III signal peptide-containing protein [Pyrococcus furiosus DSM 3638]
MKRAQTAIEYLLMLAAVLILVAIVLNVVVDSMRTLTNYVEEYTKVIRERLLESL